MDFPDIDKLITAPLRLVMTIGMLALTAYVLFRSKTPAILKEELDITRASKDRLEKENADLVAKSHQLEMELVDCNRRTDLTELMTQFKEFQSQVLNSLSHMDEQNAVKMRILEGLANTVRELELRVNGHT